MSLASDTVNPTPPGTGEVRGGPGTCPHQSACGGCQLIELTYAAQLNHKQAQVAQALHRFKALRDAVVEPTLGSLLTTRYRTRAKVVVQWEGATQVRVAYEPGTHTLVDLPDCAVLPDGMRQTLLALRDGLGGKPEIAGHVRHAVVRWSFFESRAHLTLVTDGRERGLARFARELCADARVRIAGVAVSVQAPHAPSGEGVPIQVLGPRTEPLCGDQELRERLGAFRFRMSPGSFFQANLAQAERISGLLNDWLMRDNPDGRALGTLVDLYAGVGALSIALAAGFERVIAVESHAAAAHDARQNAFENNVGHLEIRVGQAENRMPSLLADVGRARAVIVNPPRRGCRPEVLQASAALNPDRLAYVSCDPETLARDLDRLRQLGYATRRVFPLDMFPQTDQVEAVALLERLPPRRWLTGGADFPELDILYEDDDLIAVNKPSHLAVHAGTGHEADSLLSRLAARAAAQHHAGSGNGDGLAKLVPLTRLDVGSSGVVLFAKRATTGTAFARLADAGAIDRRIAVLVRGRVRPKGTITRPLADRRGGRHRDDPGTSGGAPEAAQLSHCATTKYRRVRDVGGHSLCEVELVTSRPHQARRHLASIGHPVVGDARYGDRRTNRHFEERFALVRPFIHVVRLAFPHPRTGRYLTIEAPVGGDLELVLARLEARGSLSGPRGSVVGASAGDGSLG